MMQNGTDPDGIAAAPGTVGTADTAETYGTAAQSGAETGGAESSGTGAESSGTGAEDALALAVSHLPDTRSVDFTMKVRGGAYDRLEVDNFMGELSQAIAEVRMATARVREEFATLRAGRAESGGPSPEAEDEITAGAVGLLTQAQLIADKAISDAEQYARDLVLTARNQYREILERAETSASKASATVGAQPGPPVPEVEYVRTYAQVAQIQLRSVLDALTEQVDRLGSLPQPAPEAGAESDSDEGPTGEPDWEPSPSRPQGDQSS
ncbi:DivIVA domain-containing protein [Agromyces sp. NPDC056523]|uniref:DivIVA domain-containing protein n=1 Tax=Agromyces sp. NPDC056523 TaxID=3345850 RepID=UPI00367004C6